MPKAGTDAPLSSNVEAPFLEGMEVITGVSWKNFSPTLPNMPLLLQWHGLLYSVEYISRGIHIRAMLFVLNNLVSYVVVLRRWLQYIQGDDDDDDDDFIR